MHLPQPHQLQMGFFKKNWSGDPRQDAHPGDSWSQFTSRHGGHLGCQPHLWRTPQKTDGVNLKTTGNASLRLQILEGKKYISAASKFLEKLFLLFWQVNGNPLQYSCLENPRDRGAWWAAIYGVTQSRTRLK